jgi:hypothetical protein
VDKKSSRKGCRATKSSKIIFRRMGKSSNATYRWHWFQSKWGVHYPVNKYVIQEAAMLCYRCPLGANFTVLSLLQDLPGKLFLH